MIVSYITHLTDKNYKDFVSNGLVLVDIYTNWCVPCKLISPIVDEISSEFLGKISVGKLDAEQCVETTTSLNIRNVPAILLYKDGQIVDKKVGSISKSNLEEMINKYVS
jgi:thioredoxin 1